MLIANPIYDTVFKKLLENQRVAKFFIGTLLNKKILSIEVRSPEHTYIDPDTEELRLFRMDFTVEIEMENGKSQKVIIEMQKSDKYGDNIGRFRRYLGHEYMNNKIPIVSIYILGFSLPGIDTACLKIGRNYYDLVEGKEISAISNFAERLTHDSYIVQVPKIQSRLKTPLDRLLSVFEQKNFISEEETYKDYLYPIEDDEIKEMTGILHYISSTPETRKKLDDEHYYRVYVEENFGDFYRKIEEKDKALAGKNAELANQATELANKNAELANKDAELVEQATELANKDAELAELRKKLEKYEQR